jgi:alpha-tubulin suppressor-like RCC1 family protein
MDPFEFLPDDVIIQIALHESIRYISDMCRLNTRFNNLICNNNNFWHQKFIQDFGQLPESVNITSWEDAYKNYGKVIVFEGDVKTKIKVPQSIIFVACGGDYTMMIDINNNVWAQGYNAQGQLGLGHVTSKDNPEMLKNIKAKFVACGSIHTMLIDMENNVWGCGNNAFNQLGFHSRGSQYEIIPQILPNIKAKFVACGSDHTIIIDLDDNALGFGSSLFGQLGVANSNGIYKQLMMSKIKSVSCGAESTILLDMENNVWGCGSNESGQLGMGDNELINVPTRVYWTDSEITSKAKMISCGYRHIMIIDMKDNVWTCGENEFGQLGLGDNVNRNTLTVLTSMGQNIKAKSIACGDELSAIIDFDDNIFTCGLEQNTLIQVPDVKSQSISCGGYFGVAILYPQSQFGINTKLLPFNEVVRKLNLGDFVRFNFVPEYQTIRHRPGNFIVTFYDHDGNVYLAEIQYDQSTNQILRPV